MKREISLVLLVGSLGIAVWLMFCNHVFYEKNPNCLHNPLVEHTIEFVGWGHVHCNDWDNCGHVRIEDLDSFVGTCVE